MKLNEALNLVENTQAGMERLVSAVSDRLGGKIARKDIRKYIKNLDKDEAFIERIKAKSKAIGNEGYTWTAIRSRTYEHFAKQLKSN